MSSIIGIDTSVLLGFYQAKAGIGLSTASGAAVGSGASASAAAKIPTAPWNEAQPADQVSKAISSVMAGHKFINENAAQLDVTGASQDYKKLFALWQGLGTMADLANQANAKGLSATDKQRLSEVFSKGLAEISGYVATSKFESLRMTQGALATSDKTTLKVAATDQTYVTAPLTTSTTEALAGLPDDAKFTIAVKRLGVTHNVAIDLSNLGSQPRTIGNVVNYINDQLASEGVETRLATQRTPGAPKTIEAGGQTITLSSTTSDSWALKVTVGMSETVTFSAPQTAGALYVAQNVGDPNPDKDPTTDDSNVSSQLLKFQTDTTNVATPPQAAGQAYFVDGRTFAQTLGDEVSTVHATKLGPDGSLYVLADITDAPGKTDVLPGQTLKGEQDVALMKYDSAGNLLFTQVLGAAGSASGLGLAVSADGHVAVSGSLTGTLSGATEGALNSGATGSFAENTDSFVTLYDPNGDEVWTVRRGARADDAATQVSFGADGTVYVAGSTKGTLPGASSLGGSDGYIEAFAPQTDALGKVKTLFTQQFGTAGFDQAAGMVVDGDYLTTAGVEDGHAVLRRFDISSGTPVLSATRDLGDLQGGSIAGLALDGAGNIVVAGTTSNGALSAGAVTNALSGGADAFVARLSADLAPAGGDTLTYFGGSGDDKVTALTVADGQVWIGGSAGDGDIDGQAQTSTGARDGFVAQLDLGAGTAGFVRRFAGQDGRAAPTAIAFDGDGASVLDRLGLPSGTLDTSLSERLTTATSLRPGDTFQVRAGGKGAYKTVTIEEDDTMATLALKIQRATGFQAQVKVAGAAAAGRYLTIKPQNDRSIIEFAAGATDKDALAELGIPEGAVRATIIDAKGKTLPADGKGGFYGLGLDSGLNIDSADGVKHALAVLAAAQNVVRSAYKDMVAAAMPPSAQAAAANGATGGTVPAYLTNQIANYQAALARLTGGGSGGSGDAAVSLLGTG